MPEHLHPTKLGSVPMAEEDIGLPEVPGVVGRLPEFTTAIASAQMTGLKYIEVTEALFKYFCKKPGGPTYFDYGHPSIRVYLVGTREQAERDSRRAIV